MEADSADEQRLMAVRLVVSDDLALESRDDTHVIVVNMASAARTKLSLGAYRFLKAFSSPSRVEQVVSGRAASVVLAQVRMLIDKQMLVDADAPTAADPARLRTAVAYRFCGAPAYASSKEPDFLILGLPYDLAGDIDSRLAPALIRRKSLDYSYQLDFASSRPRGWFDVNRGTWMLRGATLADGGDVPVEYGEDQARFFERVGNALAECGAGHSVPVVLGGDRSVTAAVVGALPRDHKLALVQITAQPERATAEGAGRHLLRTDKVERIISVGTHDDPPESSCDAVMLWTAARLRECGPEGVVRAWGDPLPIYLSIDLGIVEDVDIKAAKTGLRPGLTIHELKVLIAAIGKVHHIVGIDLVGLDMRSGSPDLTAIIGCHLALAAMSAAYDRL